MGSQQCGSYESSPTASSAYGDFLLVVEQNTQLALIRKSVPQAVVGLGELGRQLAKRRQIDSPNIAKLHAYSVKAGPYLIDVELKYEYVPLTLKERRSHWGDRAVSEYDLGNMLLGVEKALLELHGAGIAHRLVSLDTILCEKALYKLADNSMVTFLTGLDLARMGDRGQLLSEKNLVVLNNEGTRPEYELEDDLFSLALVALVLVLRCEPEGLYLRSYGKTRLNQSRITAGLRALDAGYDPWVGKKVRELLSGSLKSSSATNHSPCKPTLSTP